MIAAASPAERSAARSANRVVPTTVAAFNTCLCAMSRVSKTAASIQVPSGSETAMPVTPANGTQRVASVKITRFPPISARVGRTVSRSP